MSDEQSLYLVLAVIYLGDCFLWLPRSVVGFRSLAGAQWKVVLPGRILGNVRGGVVWVNPLPPLGTFFSTAPWPLSLSPEGFTPLVLQSFAGQGLQRGPAFFRSWEDPFEAEAKGGEIWIDGRRVARCPSHLAAREAVALLVSLRLLPREKREVLIEEALRRSLDLGAMDRRLWEFEGKTGALRIVACALWMLLFLGAPALSWRLGLAQSLLPLSLAGLPLFGLVLFFYFRAHRTLHPSERGERFGELFKMLLCPPLAIRAVDLLSRGLLATWHPGAVCARLLKGSAAEEALRRFLLDLSHPLASGPQPTQALEAESWFRARLQVEFHATLRRLGFDPGRLTAPRLSGDKEALSFCPRCQGEYLLPEGECSDCPGVGLLPVGQAPSIKGSSHAR